MPNSARTFEILKRIEAAGPSDSSPVHARFRAAAIDIARSENLGRARSNFAIVPLDAPPSDMLHAGGEAFHAPRMLPPSGELTALAFGVCTLGHGIERRVSALFAQRRISLALALDTLGNQMLMEASRRLQDRILADITRRSLDMAGELRAGDPGLALEAQPAILRLAGASRIGVSLTGTLSLDPLKSASVVFGVGRDLPLARWSRCDDCRSRAKCRHHARQSALAAQAGGGG
ncbi:MAG: hypothetical protein ACLQIQ_15985 [Beijerinckiaceae bacterium]